MSLFLIAVPLLLAGGLFLLYFPWSTDEGDDRDLLNNAFYQSRLKELEQENAKNPDREALVAELQRTLLSDIPVDPQVVHHSQTRWVLLPGALALVIISTGIFLKTTDISEVLAWRQAQRELPALMKRATDPAERTLRMDEIARLGLGLRSHVQSAPDDLDAWRMLGRIGLVLDNADTAVGAFGRAYQLAPDDPAIALDYAAALIRTGEQGAGRQGELILRNLLNRQPNNVRALDLLASLARREQRYQDAINIWQRMMSLLPANDRLRDELARRLIEARSRVETN
jgi:cytochrome c-type biogenesis protein CcmI